MLKTLKGKLLNVRKIGLLSPTHENKTVRSPVVNFDAGSKILSHFQEEWAELHELNEANAKNAAILAEKIDDMHSKINRSSNNLDEIFNLLNGPPLLNNSIDSCVEQLGELYESFRATERGLLELEEVIEKIELEKRKTDHIQQLVLYKEKKLASLEKVKVELVAQHEKALKEQESKQNKLSEERQQVFQEAFNDDLEMYKSLGNIPKIETKVQTSALLEEIQLDLDQQDLETFLNST